MSAWQIGSPGPEASELPFSTFQSTFLPDYLRAANGAHLLHSSIEIQRFDAQFQLAALLENSKVRSDVALAR